MTIPALLLGFLIASLYGALYHLIRNGGPGRFLRYLLSAWMGFTAGHLLGAWQGWTFLPVGPLNLGLATLGSLLFLGAVDLVETTRANGIRPFSDGENGV